MAEQEVNAINHLLEVEQNAKAMTISAQEKAEVCPGDGAGIF